MLHLAAQKYKEAQKVAKRLRFNYKKYQIKPWDLKHYRYRIYTTNEEIVGQGYVATKTFETLQLDPRTIQRFYIVFNDIDEDGSGEISKDEFYGYLKIDETAFSDRVFEIIDLDKSGEIDFREFVVCLWNYCTYDQATLSDFAFSLYDEDDGGFLDLAEIQELVNEVFGSAQEGSARVQKVLGILDADGDGVVTKEEFIHFQESCPVLLFPAFRMQQRMREKVLGIDFWEKESVKRWSLTGGRNLSIFEILQAMDRVKVAGTLDKLIKMNEDHDQMEVAKKNRATIVSNAQKIAEMDMLPGMVHGSLLDIPDLADTPENGSQEKRRGSFYRYFLEHDEMGITDQFNQNIADPIIPWIGCEKKRPNPNQQVFTSWG